MAKSNDKTNVMRLLEAKHIDYVMHTYPSDCALSAVEVARYLDENVDKVYKTLVTVGKSGNHYIFVVPGSAELDLKKAARSVSEKSIEMIKSKELLPLTGYIHGGCSPIGMKKLFATTIHIDARSLDTIIISGGKIGYQVEISPSDLEKIIPVDYADIVI